MNPGGNRVGVGVVGLGVGEQHARTYAGLPDCDLKWLFDLSQEQAAAARDRIGAGAIADSYEAILADPAVDAVSLATFDHLHFDEVLAAFRAGKHVFVEKPLCRTRDELAEIAKAWRAAGRPHLCSNLVLRDAAVYRWLADEIRAGTLGEVYAFDGDYLYGRLEKITDGWRKDVPDYSVMEGGGVHIIDLMLGFLGERPARVETIGSKVATRDTDFAYDDFMAATFCFPSGAIGRVTANFGCVHPHHHVIRLFGTKATFIYDDQGPRLFTSRAEDARAEKLDLPALPDHKGVLIPAFVEAIRSGADPTPAAMREFDLITVCAAADEAHAAGKPIEMEYET